MELWTSLVHLVFTAFMAGLIWFVQLVHYPLFGHIGNDCFREYERLHMQRTTWIVAPAMIGELLTAAALVWLLDGPGRWLAFVGLALIVALWVSTALLQMPGHRRLSHAYDADCARRLVRTNWLRTVLWSVRTGIAVALVALIASGFADGDTATPPR